MPPIAFSNYTFIKRETDQFNSNATKLIPTLYTNLWKLTEMNLQAKANSLSYKVANYFVTLMTKTDPMHAHITNIKPL